MSVNVLPWKGLQNPSVDEFLEHPEFRPIAAFFLGWVFISSLNHIISSTPVHRAFCRCYSLVSRRQSPKSHTPFGSSYLDSTSLSSKSDTHTLDLILSLGFAFASVAYFVSLLTFRPNGLGCSFAVAWGGISAQGARLVGLIILILELRRLGLPRWETALFWTWLFIGSVLVFLTNAVSVGVTRPVPQLKVSLCYKVHFLPTALASSFIYLSMEVYVTARAMSLIAPPFLKVQHRLGGVRDSRVLRAISLIVLELLCFASASRFTSILEDFVPFSIGSVLVLFAFNYHVTEPEALDFSSPSCPSIRSRRSGRPSLVIAIDSHMPGPLFARKSLSDAALENGERFSPKTTDSDFEYATSVAVARVASKRSQRSGKVVRVPPLPLSAPLASGFRRDEMRETSQLQLPHRILHSQVSYAEGFEQEVESNSRGLSARPHLAAIVIPTEAPHRPPSGYYNSPNSAFYGSDIIRMDSDRHIKDKTRRQVSAALSTYRSETAYSPRESLMSPPTPSKRYSFASHSAPLAPTNEDLSTDVYGVKSNGSRQSRKMMRWPTFDEQHFKSAGFVGSTMSQRPFSGILSVPPLPLPSTGQRVRGPRPPPTTTERSPLVPHLS